MGEKPNTQELQKEVSNRDGNVRPKETSFGKNLFNKLLELSLSQHLSQHPVAAD